MERSLGINSNDIGNDMFKIRSTLSSLAKSDFYKDYNRNIIELSLFNWDPDHKDFPKFLSMIYYEAFDLRHNKKETGLLRDVLMLVWKIQRDHILLCNP